MKDNYLFHRICKEVDKFESNVYLASVRQAKVFLKICEDFLNEHS